MPTEIELFTIDACKKRGIDPDVAITVWNAEGGVTFPAVIAKFQTGWSCWPSQLHFGGLDPVEYGAKRRDYRFMGDTPGMGNSFTYVTGWEFGDPRAWRDAIRYALNHVKKHGWGNWYGAKAQGITGMMGVDTTTTFNPASELWDFESGVDTSTPAFVLFPYYPDVACDPQPDDWSCSLESARWLLRSIGRNPTRKWMENQLVPKYITPEKGLLDASGVPLAMWLTEQYGNEMGFTFGVGEVSFDDVAAGAGENPTIIGGRKYGPAGHWVGVRKMVNGEMLLANPAPNYTNTGDTLDRNEWNARGRWTAIWIDRLAMKERPTLPPIAPVVPPELEPWQLVVQDYIETQEEHLKTLRSLLP